MLSEWRPVVPLANISPGGRSQKSNGETLHDKVILRVFAKSHDGIFAGADPDLNTTNTENNTEMKNDTEESLFHRIAKVHHILEMWQSSQKICVTQKNSHAQNNNMTAVAYLSHMEEVLKESWSLVLHLGVAVFTL
jgi:hypothetical protein